MTTATAAACGNSDSNCPVWLNNAGAVAITAVTARPRTRPRRRRTMPCTSTSQMQKAATSTSFETVVVEVPQVHERRQKQRQSPRIRVRAEGAGRVDDGESVVGDDFADVAVEQAAGLAEVQREVVTAGRDRCGATRWRARRRPRSRIPRAIPTQPTPATVRLPRVARRQPPRRDRRSSSASGHCGGWNSSGPSAHEPGATEDTKWARRPRTSRAIPGPLRDRCHLASAASSASCLATMSLTACMLRSARRSRCSRARALESSVESAWPWKRG